MVRTKGKISRRLVKDGRVCYKMGEEKGLWYERKCVQDVIKNKTARSENCEFEKRLLKSWEGYSEADYSYGEFPI